MYANSLKDSRRSFVSTKGVVAHKELQGFKRVGTRKRPLTLAGPDIKLECLKAPDFKWHYDKPAYTFKIPSSSALIKRENTSVGMGSFLDDIWNFIKRIIESIINAIRKIIAKIIEFFKNPLKVLRELFGVLLKVVTGAYLLDWLENCPLTRWLYLWVDHLTGGFLSSLKILAYLPGKYVAGETITREEIVKALGVLQVVVGVGIGLLTGNLGLVLIATSGNLLKQGPLGKTTIGRLLLDVVSIGAMAMVGGVDLSSAFQNAGKDVLKREGLKFVGEKTGVPSDVLNLVYSQGGALYEGQSFEATAAGLLKGGLQTSLVPEPLRLVAGATYAVHESPPGQELEAAKDFSYDTLEDKSPVAALVYKNMTDPTQIATSLSSGAEKSLQVFSDPGNALSEGAKAAQSAMSNYQDDILSDLAKGVAIPSLPGLPDINIDPKELADAALKLLLERQMQKANLQRQQVIEQIIYEEYPYSQAAVKIRRKQEIDAAYRKKVIMGTIGAGGLILALASGLSGGDV